MPTTVLVAGATGLVGSAVLRQALAAKGIDRVVVLVRKPMAIEHPKLQQWNAPSGELLSGLRDEPVEAVICCLGTTIRNVGGNQQKFIHVDKNLVVGLGEWAKRLGARSFAVVSAIGADPRSRVFYSRVKGEMEQDLAGLALPQLHIFRPSILNGPRQEFRLGERIGVAVMKLFRPVMLGSLAKYKPMPSEVLAKAMINAALSKGRGSAVCTHAYRSIMELARG